jgi:hypothetical protein
MATESTPPLWRFIRLNQYSRPPESSREAVRKGFFGLWHHLGWGNSSEDSVFAEKDLTEVPQDLLDKAAANPDWSAAQAAVTEVLQSWLDAKVPGSSTQIFVGPPYHGTPEILASWGRSQGWRLISPPSPELILAGGETWLTQSDEGNGPLVLPHLEHCFLRHYDGLILLRRLLDRIFSHSHRWLVGCDSWAWAYLSNAINIDAVFPPPFILEGFDQERLRLWFQQLAAQSEETTFTFRQADNGKFVLPPVSEDGSAGEQNQVSSDFLKYIASFSLGIPGIAWTAWRSSLSFVISEKENAKENDQQPQSDEPANHAYPIWVKPWSQLSLPKIPSQRASHSLLMVFQALLIHGGLWSRVLPEILPLSPIEIMEHLYLLEAAGLVESQQGFWQVTPLGYPVIRGSLQTEGYLIDAV